MMQIGCVCGCAVRAAVERRSGKATRESAASQTKNSAADKENSANTAALTISRQAAECAEMTLMLSNNSVVVSFFSLQHSQRTVEFQL